MTPDPVPVSAIRVANAPCSWGVIEDVGDGGQDPRRMLDEMAATGYAGTELGDWGFLPTDPVVLGQELGMRGLSLVGSFATPWLQDPARHERSADDAVRIGRLLAAVGGPDALVVLGNDPYGDPARGRIAGRVTAADGMSEETWAVFTKGA